MKKAMKIRVVISALFLMWATSSVSHGQAVPAGVVTVDTAPTAVPLDGVVHYALTASEIVALGFYGSGQTTASTDLSGDVAYSGRSLAHPFTLLFAGGVLLPNGSGQGVTTFQTLSVSQGYITHHWIFHVADSFTFLPESATTGVSGIPGVGDVGVVPIQGPGEGPAGGILTVSGNRIANGLLGGVEREITPLTSISGTGSWSTLHFLDSQADALDYSQFMGSAAVNRRIDQRSSASLGVSYGVYDFSGPEAGANTPSFQTRSINLSYQRLMSREFSVSGTIGPQWVSSSNSALIPSTLNVAGSASVNYTRRLTTASVHYSRGVNGGSGVLPGAISDDVGFGAGRPYGRNWVGSLSGAYIHSSGLSYLGALTSLQGTTPTAATPVHEVYNTAYATVQARRRINANFSGFLTFTVADQSTNYSSGTTQPVLNGTSEIFGIGISFAPRSTSLGQF
jgi:hypothetical protein